MIKVVSQSKEIWVRFGRIAGHVEYPTIFSVSVFFTSQSIHWHLYSKDQLHEFLCVTFLDFTKNKKKNAHVLLRMQRSLKQFIWNEMMVNHSCHVLREHIFYR